MSMELYLLIFILQVPHIVQVFVMMHIAYMQANSSIDPGALITKPEMHRCNLLTLNNCLLLLLGEQDHSLQTHSPDQCDQTNQRMYS